MMGNISRVLSQNGVSQARYIVEKHHSGRKPSIYFNELKIFTLVIFVVEPRRSRDEQCCVCRSMLEFKIKFAVKHSPFAQKV